MPPLADAEPLEGAITPDPGTYEPAGNKFTRSHSPGTEEDNSDDPPANSQETPDCSQQDSKTARSRSKKTIHQLQIFIPELQI